MASLQGSNLNNADFLFEQHLFLNYPMNSLEECVFPDSENTNTSHQQLNNIDNNPQTGIIKREDNRFAAVDVIKKPISKKRLRACGFKLISNSQQQLAIEQSRNGYLSEDEEVEAEESAECMDKEDSVQEESDRLKGLKRRFRLKNRGEIEHFLDNVRVNKLKNFYKTFMNRIKVPLIKHFHNNIEVVKQINKLCTESNQRKFLQLFPFLRQKPEINNQEHSDLKEEQEINKDNKSIDTLRKTAFELFGNNFHQLVRIIKCNKSFKQLEEFIYGCLYYAERSQKIVSESPQKFFEGEEVVKPLSVFRFVEPDLQAKLDNYEASNILASKSLLLPLVEQEQQLNCPLQNDTVVNIQKREILHSIEQYTDNNDLNMTHVFE